MVVVKNIIEFIIIVIVGYIILNTLNTQFLWNLIPLYIISVFTLFMYVYYNYSEYE